jgi:DNA-binding NarL/FixJ family response regulator
MDGFDNFYQVARSERQIEPIEARQIDRLDASRDNGYIAIIDRRMLERECLAHSLTFHHVNRRVFTFSNLQECEAADEKIGKPAAVLFNAANDGATGQQLIDEISDVVEALAPAAVVVLSDNQDINTVLDIIASGVRGYIPTSVSIEVCIQAISLAIAGGRFIPASSLVGMRDILRMPAQKAVPVTTFTSRQSAVAQALRCGKANRDIAVELNLCESTIKVHIRNIMKKLGATNRTEVACRIGEMAAHC